MAPHRQDALLFDGGLPVAAMSSAYLRAEADPLWGADPVPVRVESRIYRRPTTAELTTAELTPLAQSQPSDPSVDAGRHFQEAIRRWGNSLEVRLPAHCLRLAGLQEGDRIVIVVGADGRLSLEPLQRQDRSALTADWLRQAGLQATMPLTPSVIEECRDCERW